MRQNRRIRQVKWSVLVRSQNARIMLTACSQMLTACSQMPTDPSNRLPMAQKNTDATWAVLRCSLMALERSLLLKLFQSHSESGQFSPSISRPVFYGTFNIIQLFPRQMAQIYSNRSNFHHYLVVKFPKIFILIL